VFCSRKELYSPGFLLPYSAVVQIVKIEYFHVYGLGKRNPGNQVCVSGIIPVYQDRL
jgi:hypothetical protein